ncbi:acetolactate synthase 3 large subunit [Pontivivens insulae]|uniref:Acetolactate synthase n=1 Tax=Pontivivens insulae TaxID=1639689 RepID=A0A2R8AAH4_9RHOB|nr:acetolactate synthase 3 large subunit [Pontivivens insulae]RED13132.1 acetolactate synthase large subunit [Pontivivens insulae]SPF29224.1 Acetolactate synthase isozyme 3 large subunit [Pontivivens insulae]
MTRMSGAEIVVKSLIDQGVDTVFGYPGGAVLPIYDEIFKQNSIKHILVRHEQAATHAAEGYARSTGKPGVVLVTSGPGATNAVTGLTDALMDSIPLVVLTGQVPTFMIGNDAFQEADTVGITRPCTKHNWLVKETDALAETLHQAFHVATNGRPGPVLIDIPKDVQFAEGSYMPPKKAKTSHYQPQVKGDMQEIAAVVEAMAKAKRPIIYSGGGVINSGSGATQLLRELVSATGFPITSTLMGLGCYPASGKNWLGMLGMHGTYEANMAMHDCDFMLCIGARFDDRITGRTDAFSPKSVKVHIDIDPSSINKNIRVDHPIVGDVGHILEDLLRMWKADGRRTNADAVKKWWGKIDDWRAIDCLKFKQEGNIIKPQYALERLEALTKGMDRYITTEVGQHQMWAAQYLGFEEPNRWMTSGGLGTMGYGFPASVGVQIAHPEALVINVAGEASWLMNMQEMGTAMQYGLPVKQFILNNERLGMVRQWQELLHGERYSSSWSESLPDFVKLAEAFGAKGILCDNPEDLDEAIKEMLAHDGPVLFDCLVEKHENCFPMIPSGKAHNEMLLGENADTANAIQAGGAVLV